MSNTMKILGLEIWVKWSVMNTILFHKQFIRFLEVLGVGEWAALYNFAEGYYDSI